jgi:hypothetical protein
VQRIHLFGYWATKIHLASENSQNLFTRVFKWYHSSLHACMKFIFYAFRVTIWTYTVLNRSNWMGISTSSNMELVVTSTKTCKNVSMANISNIRNISFVSKYKLKFWHYYFHNQILGPAVEKHSSWLLAAAGIWRESVNVQ